MKKMLNICAVTLLMFTLNSGVSTKFIIKEEKKKKIRIAKKNQAATRINCTILDHIHFRKIEFWDDSYPATHYTNYTFNNQEVYLSFCQKIPDSIFKKCGISQKKKSNFFYISLKNQTCNTIKFSQIKYISYSKTEIGDDKQIKQITIEFFVNEIEHSLTFPDFKIKKIQYFKEKNVVEIRMPLGLIPPKTGRIMGPEIRGLFLWNFEALSTSFYLFQGLIAIFTIWFFMGYKLGQKVNFFGIRPFDFVMNVELSYILFKSMVEISGETDSLWNSILVGVIPILFGILVNWKVPSFSWRVSSSKKIYFFFQFLFSKFFYQINLYF